MIRKVSDWRKTDYKVGDKLYMTTQSSFLPGEPSGREVTISHIGKTVLKVKPDIDKNYELSFKNGKSFISDFGQFHILYENEEEYIKEKHEEEYRENLKKQVKLLIHNIPNDVLEELVEKYGKC